MTRFTTTTALALTAAALTTGALSLSRSDASVSSGDASISVTSTPVVTYATETIDGLDVFYREAGPQDAPVVLLLHGFPTSSHMFRDMIPQLATEFRVIAPDYPGYGHSSMPDRADFEYTFANYADLIEELTQRLGLDTYSLYLMDYGAPVGFRLFEKAPEKVDAFLIQNGNAYVEGLETFWDPIKDYWKTGADAEREVLRPFLTIETTEWQYTHGTRNPNTISPDTWTMDQWFLDRPGNQEIQLDLFYDYRTNVDRYPAWQALFREHQVPTLITWGKNDYIFPEAGAHPYTRDLKDVETHILDTGHFALEEDGELIGTLITDFLRRKVLDAE